MSRTRFRSAIAPDSAPSPAAGSLLDFYREELLRHQACLEAQREYYSDLAILEAEAAIARVLTHLEGLIPSRDGCARLESLLRTFDQVTGLSGRTDPSRLH